MATPKVANRYPRPGERIAPLALRDVLTEPIPKRLRDRLGGAELRLCDLDESVMAAISAGDDQPSWPKPWSIAFRLIRRLRTLQIAVFRVLMPGLRLDDLRLENRTRRCLMREGLDDQLERLGNYTLGEILSIRAFGPRCLLDLLTALESLQKTAGGGKKRDKASSKLSAELTAEAEKLAALEAVTIRRPR